MGEDVPKWNTVVALGGGRCESWWAKRPPAFTPGKQKRVMS